MSHVRLSDAELRRLAGGDRSVRKETDLKETFRKPISALNHEERKIMLQRLQFKRAVGPSVVGGSSATVVCQASDMDTLIDEILSNRNRAILLDDIEGNSGLNDARAAGLASALRHNRSIVAVTLRGVRITEVGMASICESLKRNRSVRALELQYVGLTPKSMRNILSLVRFNSNIIQVGLFRTGADDDPVADEIAESIFFNRMTVSDPKTNQYENWLFAYDSQEATFDGFAWDAESGDEGEHFREAEARAFTSSSGKLARPVCNHFLKGTCVYGSRCRHFHPERTTDEEELREIRAPSTLDDAALKASVRKLANDLKAKYLLQQYQSRRIQLFEVGTATLITGLVFSLLFLSVKGWSKKNG